MKGTINKCLLLILFIIFSVSCKSSKDEEKGSTPPEAVEPDGIITEQGLGLEGVTISDDFNFSSQKKIGVHITVYTPLGTLQKNALVQVFTAKMESSLKPTKDSALQVPTKLIATGRTNAQGVYQNQLLVAAPIKELTVIVGAFGIPNRKTLLLSKNLTIQAIFKK